MNNIAVLHLSDLHIDDKSTRYSKILKKLIGDIKDQIKILPDKSMVIVVTGDIIHQGNAEASKRATLFFKDLYEVVKQKVCAIYLVPGNHDKKRTTENEFLIPAYRMMNSKIANIKKESKFDDVFYDSFWKYQEESYGAEKGSGYLEFSKEIYKIFGKDIELEDKYNYIRDTFGVDVVEILGKKYCFVMFNTAWSCVDDEDNRNLIFGKFQMESIKKQFAMLVDEHGEDNIELTITMGHHPLNALFGEEEDSVFSEMISFEQFNANAYLCGHTHDRTVINWGNNRHSINTFMTGIGWPEGNSHHIGAHTYSIYVFNLSINSIDIYVRSTDDGGEFNPDFRMYTKDTNRKDKKIIYPINAQKTQTYIHLGAVSDHSSKAYYISDEFMKYLKEYVLGIGKLRQFMGMAIEADKSNLYESVEYEEDDIEYEEDDVEYESSKVKYKYVYELQEYTTEYIMYNYFFGDVLVEEEVTENDEVNKVIEGFFKDNSKLIFDMFLGYLQKLCQKLERIFLFDKTDEGDIVRVHFRYLADRSSLTYVKLCESFSEETDITEHSLSEFKYGDLIEEAHKSNKVLLYSANRDSCKNELKKKWKNFLTCIPMFKGNIFKKNYGDDNVKEYPFITFGITTNVDKYDKLLYCMDYLSIGKMLEEMIDVYVRIFKIDINKFCIYIKDEIKKENENEQ